MVPAFQEAGILTIYEQAIREYELAHTWKIFFATHLDRHSPDSRRFRAQDRVFDWLGNDKSPRHLGPNR
jgi:hypothetical protein